MILPLNLSLRRKNFLSTRTTHREELEYILITFREIIRFGAQEIKIFPERLRQKILEGLIYNWKRMN